MLPFLITKHLTEQFTKTARQHYNFINTFSSQWDREENTPQIQVCPEHTSKFKCMDFPLCFGLSSTHKCCFKSLEIVLWKTPSRGKIFRNSVCSDVMQTRETAFGLWHQIMCCYLLLMVSECVTLSPLFTWGNMGLVLILLREFSKCLQINVQSLKNVNTCPQWWNIKMFNGGHFWSNTPSHRPLFQHFRTKKQSDL